MAQQGKTFTDGLVESVKVEKVASVFGMDESALIIGRMKRRQQEREAFVTNVLSPRSQDALQLIDARLEDEWLRGDGDL